MKMKLKYFYVAALAVLTLGCKEKKQAEVIIATKQEAPKPTAPVKMQPYEDSRQVKWVGRTYTVEVKRRADDSLRMVKDETGQKFVDNRITVSVIRGDGSKAFHREFTKADFDAYIDNTYRHDGILEGIVFDEVDDNELEFAASVCIPQTDEYIPLVLKVDNFGKVSIKLDNRLDTYGGDDDDEPDD